MTVQPGFDQKVWELASRISPGSVTTYKSIAERLDTRAYQAVGNALHRNPHWPRVPCHRVVKNNGEVGGFGSGTEKKIALLRKEGIEISEGRIVNLKSHLHRFV